MNIYFMSVNSLSNLTFTGTSSDTTDVVGVSQSTENNETDTLDLGKLKLITTTTDNNY